MALYMFTLMKSYSIQLPGYCLFGILTESVMVQEIPRGHLLAEAYMSAIN